MTAGASTKSRGITGVRGHRLGHLTLLFLLFFLLLLFLTLSILILAIESQTVPLPGPYLNRSLATWARCLITPQIVSWDHTVTRPELLLEPLDMPAKLLPRFVELVTSLVGAWLDLPNVNVSPLLHDDVGVPSVALRT